MKPYHLAFVFAISAALFCSDVSSGPIDEPMAELATQINAFITESNRPRKIIVGQFPGIPSMRANGGVEIKRSLTEQLERLGIEVTSDALLSIMGRFKKAKSKQDEYFVQIEAQILDGNGNELVEFLSAIEGTAALVIGGETIGIEPDAQTPMIGEQFIATAVANPKTIIEPPPRGKSTSVIRPNQSSLFGLEILTPYQDAEESVNASFKEKRRAYVELKDGQEYLVKLYNDADFEVAVELTIDGVHSFELSDNEEFKNSKYVIAPKSTRIAKGWFRNTNEVKAFLIGGYEGSVAQQQGLSLSDVGVITATFQASWEPGAEPPPDESIPNIAVDPMPQAPPPAPIAAPNPFREPTPKKEMEDSKPLAPSVPIDDREEMDLERIFEKKENNPLASMLGEGMNQFYSGKYDEAREILTDAIDRGLEDPRAYYFRGMIAFNRGNNEDAVVDWTIGADLEAHSKADFEVGRSLQRFQGVGRIQLERIRRNAQIFAAKEKQAEPAPESAWRREVREQLRQANERLRRNPVGVAGSLKSLLAGDIAATAEGRVIDEQSRSVSRQYGVNRAVISVRYTKSPR